MQSCAECCKEMVDFVKPMSNLWEGGLKLVCQLCLMHIDSQ